jgi:hypothetical protein
MAIDEKDLLKVGAQEAMKPFANLLERLFGGVVDQIGGVWSDQMKVRRFERQLKLFRRVQELIEDSGIEPQLVADKIGIPLLMAAPLEDDPGLQELWACLLANAATIRGSVEPSFVEILKQLSPQEAKLVDLFYQRARGWLETTQTPVDQLASPVEIGPLPTVLHIYCNSGLVTVPPGGLMPTNVPNPEGMRERHRFNAMLDNIMRLRLVETLITTRTSNFQHMSFQPLPHTQEVKYVLTNLGIRLMVACHPPEFHAQSTSA